MIKAARPTALLLAAGTAKHPKAGALITWKPDYDAFYYRQLRRRARSLYLFRSEYIFDLEAAVVVETSQLGHATYLFSRPASLTKGKRLAGRPGLEPG